VSGTEVDPAAIITGIANVAVAVGTAFAVIRSALKKWQQAQEDERAEQGKRAEAERAEQARLAYAERAEQAKRAEAERAEHLRRAEAERQQQAAAAELEKAEYRNVVKTELRRGLGPIRRRLAHLEGAVEALLRGGSLPRQSRQGKRGGR
jgi:hypothetical protein